MAIQGVIPQLRTTDLDATIAFYTDTLGFELEFRHSDFYAGIKTPDAADRIHLKLVDDKDPSIDFVRAGDHLHLYFPTDDVEATAARLKARGVAFVKEVAATAWGTKDFYISDDQGHVIAFAEEAR